MITAKPIVKNKYWILKEDDRKIGTVERNSAGYEVRVADQIGTFKTIKTLENKTNIRFETSKDQKDQFENQVNGFPTDGKPFNGVYNVQARLPLYTKKEKSKSWYAAGYYRVTVNGTMETMFCPKLILLQRYDYMGPVKTRDGFEFK